MESHLEALCEALMAEKIEDKEETISENEVGVGESGSRVT